MYGTRLSVLTAGDLISLLLLLCAGIHQLVPITAAYSLHAQLATGDAAELSDSSRRGQLGWAARQPERTLSPHTTSRLFSPLSAEYDDEQLPAGRRPAQLPRQRRLIGRPSGLARRPEMFTPVWTDEAAVAADWAPGSSRLTYQQDPDVTPQQGIATLAQYQRQDSASLSNPQYDQSSRPRQHNNNWVTPPETSHQTNNGQHRIIQRLPLQPTQFSELFIPTNEHEYRFQQQEEAEDRTESGEVNDSHISRKADKQRNIPPPPQHNYANLVLHELQRGKSTDKMAEKEIQGYAEKTMLNEDDTNRITTNANVNEIDSTTVATAATLERSRAVTENPEHAEPAYEYYDYDDDYYYYDDDNIEPTFDEVAEVSSMIKHQLNEKTYDIHLPFLSSMKISEKQETMNKGEKKETENKGKENLKFLTTQAPEEIVFSTITAEETSSMSPISDTVLTLETIPSLPQTIPVETTKSIQSTKTPIFLFSNFPSFTRDDTNETTSSTPSTESFLNILTMTGSTATIKHPGENAAATKDGGTPDNTTTKTQIVMVQGNRHELVTGQRIRTSNSSLITPHSQPPTTSNQYNETSTTIEQPTVTNESTDDKHSINTDQTVQADFYEEAPALTLGEIRAFIQPFSLAEMIVESGVELKHFLNNNYSKQDITVFVNRLRSRKHGDILDVMNPQPSIDREQHSGKTVSAQPVTTRGSTVGVSKEPPVNFHSAGTTKTLSVASSTVQLPMLELDKLVLPKTPEGFDLPEPEMLDISEVLSLLKTTDKPDTIERATRQPVKKEVMFHWNKERKLPSHLKRPTIGETKRKISVKRTTTTTKPPKITITTTKAPKSSTQKPLSTRRTSSVRRKRPKGPLSLVEILEEKGMTLPQFLAKGGNVKQLLIEYNKEWQNRPGEDTYSVDENETDDTETVPVMPLRTTKEKPNKIYSLADILRRKNMTLKEFITAGHSVEDTLNEYNGPDWRLKKTTATPPPTEETTLYIPAFLTRKSVTATPHMSHKAETEEGETQSTKAEQDVAYTTTRRPAATLPTLKSLLGEGGKYHVSAEQSSRIDYRRRGGASDGSPMFGRRPVMRTRIQGGELPQRTRYSSDPGLLEDTGYRYEGERFDQKTSSSSSSELPPDQLFDLINRETDSLWERNGATNGERQVDGTPFEGSGDESSDDSAVINSVITSSVVGGCAICFFIGVLVFCRWHQQRNLKTSSAAALRPSGLTLGSDCSSSPLDPPITINLNNYAKAYKHKSAGFWGSLRRSFNQRYADAYSENPYGSSQHT